MSESGPEQEKIVPSADPDVTPGRTFLPEHLKKPNLPPNKFKYIPPKGGKRHF